MLRYKGEQSTGMRYFLNLGSNLGDRKANLARATGLIEKGGVRIISKSSIFESEPVDFLDQPWFFNQVMEVESDLTPLAMLNLAKKIERKMKRTPGRDKGPRRIDLDLLLAEEMVINSDVLKIPHPRMAQRNFVLVPLNEIAPKVVHPVLKKNIRQLFRESMDRSVVKPIK
jgi:2-amino-4-hydroxy-6-hydroxymethyldihydropteridine diphosphokinase